MQPHFGSNGLIAIDFPDFADGRGFSLARRLRSLGYRGHLRARGSIIADQFGQALSCGFDEVEIDDLLARVPEGFDPWEIHERDGGYFVPSASARVIVHQASLAPDLAALLREARDALEQVERDLEQ